MSVKMSVGGNILSVVVAVAILLAAGVSTAAQEEIIPIPNGDFEKGLEGWRIEESNEAMSSLVTEKAASGKHSLKVHDKHKVHGSNVFSPMVPLSGAGDYELRGMVYPVSGGGMGMYIHLLDKNKERIDPDKTIQRGLGGSENQWKPFTMRVLVYNKNAAYAQLWIHSYSHALVEAYLDDLTFARVGDVNTKPPWEGTYKIDPSEKDRLTAADVVGPDGIVYPDWTRAGVQGGIPEVEDAAKIEDFGAKAGDDTDDSAALDAACRAVGEKGGGAVVLGQGVYHMDWPVTVRHDNVVIRGQGADKTRIIFRYAIPKEGVGFFKVKEGDTIYPDTYLHIQAEPTDLQKMVLKIGDYQVMEWKRSQHSGNTFSRGKTLWNAAKQMKSGEHTLTGTATYADGSTKTNAIRVTFDTEGRKPEPQTFDQAAIAFQGRGPIGPKMLLAKDGKRGDTVLEVKKVEDLEAGDRVYIQGPATERWKKLTQNVCKWGMYRRNAYLVNRIDGNRVAIDQPLRIEFPVIDGSFIQKAEPIMGCGVEDFYIEQTENLWIHTVNFRDAWNCWAKGVTVRMCGRNPIYGYRAKFCEIRDCTFDDAWFKRGGGTAYTGWEYSWDCLMEDVTTYKMRHAPLFQWSASGNVIRKGAFHDSDGQWHSGWTNENLFEQCVITSRRGHGSYGFGMWASPPEDAAHGPNGPRNVVYNCDVYSEKAGLWMGGMNENWLILHNRFVVETGEGVFCKTASFDHIIQGNVFVLKDEKSPMMTIATPDCIGIELRDNIVYGGSGKLTAGMGDPAAAEGNAFKPLTDNAPRPEPKVPSIYEWQLKHAAK